MFWVISLPHFDFSLQQTPQKTCQSPIDVVIFSLPKVEKIERAKKIALLTNRRKVSKLFFC